MIKLYDWNRVAKSKSEALKKACLYTGFSACDFKCEVIEEPKRIGIFKKEEGIYHCWYEYNGMDADKIFRIADATLYFDTRKKKILVKRMGYKVYEVEYSDLVGYEMVIVSKNRTYTVSNNNKNKALKGAILFGTVGAIVGAADSENTSKTVEFGEIIIRLKFTDKESFEILTCYTQYDMTSKLWRDIIDQSKILDEYFKEIMDKQ